MGSVTISRSRFADLLVPKERRELDDVVDSPYQ